LSSDRTMTWSLLTLCSFSCSFTSRGQICERTNIRWVAIKNLRMSLKIWCYFSAIQWILVRSQIWKWEVEERLKLQNLPIHHVMILWDLRRLIAAKVAGTVQWNRGGGKTCPKNCGFLSGAGRNPAKTLRVRLLAGSGTESNWTAGQIPDPRRVNWSCC